MKCVNVACGNHNPDWEKGCTKLNLLYVADCKRFLVEDKKSETKSDTKVVTRKKDVFEKMAERWPSSVVARNKVAEFSGFMVQGTHLANCDSKGIGPKVRVKIGKHIGYPVADLIEWLRAQSEVRTRP